MREKNDINEFNVDQRNTISNLISDFRKKIYSPIAKQTTETSG